MLKHNKTYINGNGYVYVLVNNQYRLQHRVIMELFLKRAILKHEVVHHINEKKSDNRIVNLKLLNRAEHLKFHKNKKKEQFLKRQMLLFRDTQLSLF